MTGTVATSHGIVDGVCARCGILEGYVRVPTEPCPGPDVWSSTVINGEPQTWRQLYEREVLERGPGDEGLRMLRDLSRNASGRFEGEADAYAIGNSGISAGNPHLTTGQIIGYSLGGMWMYVVPAPELRGLPSAWRVKRPRAEE